MKFLIQIPQLIFGGAEKVLVSFANELVARGHEVEVLETYERGYLRPQFDSRVTFHAICSNDYTKKYYASLVQVRKNPLLIGKLVFSKLVGYRRFAEKLAARHYADKEYDVAINYLEIESPEFLLDHVRAGKYFQWYHTDVANLEDPEKTDKLIPAFSRMDAVICVAQSAKKSFVERYPELAPKTHVIYNFFDANAIMKMSAESFSFNEPLVLLSVGRMTPPKKYLRFLDVLARLKEDGFAFSWHVLGTGLEQDAICQKIQTLGLDNCVHLDGLTENPYKYMKHCDLFVLPSGWEGFPTVTVEAKVVGCAVLATDVSGIREQFHHGKTGWIVENNEDAIYEGLKYLMENPNVIQKLRSREGMEAICSNEEKYREFMAMCVCEGKKPDYNDFY